MSEVSERRDGPRVPIELRVEYKRLNSFFADYTRNISRGGTFIRTSRPLPIGTEFVFQLVVPNLVEPIAIKGRVQWVVEHPDTNEGTEPGMGIHFCYDHDEDRHVVERTVEKLMIDSLGPVLYARLLGRAP